MDDGQKSTEKEFLRLLLILKGIFAIAEKESKKRLEELTKPFEKKSERLIERLANDEIEEIEYNVFVRTEVFSERNKKSQWKKILPLLLLIFEKANENAIESVYQAGKTIFRENAIFMAGEMKLSYEFYSNVTLESSTHRIIKQLNRKKNAQWNNKNIGTAITQGIINGESIPQIADRIAKNVSNMNLRTMQRYARTAVTGFQNAARLEIMRISNGLGIKTQKQWLSTHDSRVRDVHADLDGQIQDVDDPFSSQLGEIMYPGDTSADPANFWNCRCCLIYHYPDHK